MKKNFGYGTVSLGLALVITVLTLEVKGKSILNSLLNAMHITYSSSILFVGLALAAVGIILGIAGRRHYGAIIGIILNVLYAILTVVAIVM